MRPVFVSGVISSDTWVSSSPRVRVGGVHKEDQGVDIKPGKSLWQVKVGTQRASLNATSDAFGTQEDLTDAEGRGLRPEMGVVEHQGGLLDGANQ